MNSWIITSYYVTRWTRNTNIWNSAISQWQTLCTKKHKMKAMLHLQHKTLLLCLVFTLKKNRKSFGESEAASSNLSRARALKVCLKWSSCCKYLSFVPSPMLGNFPKRSTTVFRSKRRSQRWISTSLNFKHGCQTFDLKDAKWEFV